MLRRTGSAHAAVLAAVVATISAPATAQAPASVPPDQPAVATSSPPAAATETARPSNPESASPSAQPSEAAPPQAAAAPPAPPVDPLLAEVRRQLAEPARGAVDRTDRAALAAFYSERNDPLLWVSAEGFTPRAEQAIAEIRKADDWGLSASAFELPNAVPRGSDPAVLAAAEIKLGLAVLKYARHARGGRLDPAAISRHIDVKLSLRDPKAVLIALAATETPGNYVRDLHPKHDQFLKLRQALLKARSGVAAPQPEKPGTSNVRLPDGPSLKPGSEHPQVALLRQRLGLASPRGAETVYDPELQDAVRAFQQLRGIQPTGILTPRTRQALNAGVVAEKQAAPAGSEQQRLIVNMERWRWMPERLGEFHVQDNIPEFMARVFRKGQLIHSAKIVVGKVNTPTAVFSANMKTIVFHPEWGVPDSIKMKEIAPYLSGGGGGGFFFFGGGDTSILERQRMRVVYNGRPVDASTVNWSSVDIRRFSFIQSAGPHNVLGVVKFLFPNKHDIYMHDTPQRDLLEHPRRLYSHGCMRVQNPGRLAEIILAEDKGWPAEQVRGLLAQGNNNEVQLSREIPVHVTYFTAVAGEGGQVNHLADPYGYDGRMVAALTGKALPPEAVGDDDPPREAMRRARQPKQADFFSGLFGN
ncbi:MAG TPA: L,D-transpeptidase family protein [Hyphomicrobiaceae bacterium]|nr:L,D-transpeptidase family protein [Hyphomicrobiaceae bacterium]